MSSDTRAKAAHPNTRRFSFYTFRRKACVTGAAGNSNGDVDEETIPVDEETVKNPPPVGFAQLFRCVHSFHTSYGTISKSATQVC